MSKTEVATYVHHLSLSNVDLFHWPKLLSIDLVKKDYVNWHSASSFVCYAGVRTISSQCNLQDIMSTAHGNTYVSFLTSNKGNQLLVLDGFLLKTNKQTKTKKNWTC